MVVPKQDGSYHLCGDYKVTVNQALEVDQYLMPKLEDLLATLAGQKFTKLDLREAYQQLRLMTSQNLTPLLILTKDVYSDTQLPLEDNGCHPAGDSTDLLIHRRYPGHWQGRCASPRTPAGGADTVGKVWTAAQTEQV